MISAKRGYKVNKEGISGSRFDFGYFLGPLVNEKCKIEVIAVGVCIVQLF